MPRVDYNTKQAFDSAYDVDVEWDTGRPQNRKGVRLKYSRAVLLPLIETRALKLLEIFNWPSTIKLLIVGGGFGWLAEVLEEHFNFNNIAVTDTSNYVHSSKNVSEDEDIFEAIRGTGLDPNYGEGSIIKSRILGKARGEGVRTRHSKGVLNESLKNNGSRARVKNQLGGNPDVILTEEVITCLEDSETINLSQDLHFLCDTIIHLTTELLPNNLQDLSYNWKTLDDWKQLLPNDTLLSLNTWRVI